MTNQNKYVIVKYEIGNKSNFDNTVDQAKISAKENGNNDKSYMGMTSLNSKFRFYNHQQSFRNPTLRNQSITGI